MHEYEPNETQSFAQLNLKIREFVANLPGVVNRLDAYRELSNI